MMQHINFLKKIIKQAGDIALAEQKNLIIQTKPDKSKVSNGDIATSLFLEQELSSKFPEWSILSEESTPSLTRNKLIIIDPIDGTESYIRGQDSWSILIGFFENGQITGGLVYQPVLEKLYYGFLNKGAFLETKNFTKTIQSIRSKNMEKIGLRSFKEYGEDSFFKKNAITSVKESYSAALKIMEIAQGNANIYANFRKKCSIWDLVAPLAILNEAKGTFKSKNNTQLSLTTFHYNDDFIVLSEDSNHISFDS